MNKIKYGYSEDQRSIIFPQGAPFDGKDYLIKFAEGWMEARWIDQKPPEGYAYTETEPFGFLWCCLDDRFQKELDEALGWLPLPVEPPVKEKHWYDNITKPVQCKMWDDDFNKYEVGYVTKHTHKHPYQHGNVTGKALFYDDTHACWWSNAKPLTSILKHKLNRLGSV